MMLTIALVVAAPLSLLVLPSPLGIIACCCGVVALFMLESEREWDDAALRAEDEAEYARHKTAINAHGEDMRRRSREAAPIYAEAGEPLSPR